MIVDSGPVVVLTGQDCARLDRRLRTALCLAYLAHRQLPPHDLVEHADAIHRVAELFRDNLLAETGSRTGADAVIADWPSSGQADQLPVARAAAITGVSESYITRELRGGRLAGARSGPRGSWLVDAASLAAWEASRRTQGEVRDGRCHRRDPGDLQELGGLGPARRARRDRRDRAA